VFNRLLTVTRKLSVFVHFSCAAYHDVDKRHGSHDDVAVVPRYNDVLGGFDKDRAVAFMVSFLTICVFGLYRQNDVSKPNVDFQRDEFYNEDIQEQPPVSFRSYRIGYGYGGKETNRYIDKTDEFGSLKS
jgi:hypothetical protein